MIINSYKRLLYFAWLSIQHINRLWPLEFNRVECVEVTDQVQQCEVTEVRNINYWMPDQWSKG